MVGFKKALFLSAASGLVLGAGALAYGDEGNGSTAPGITPRTVVSSPYAADQAWEMRKLAVKPAAPLAKRVAVTAQPPAGSPQPAWQYAGPTGYGRIWDIEVDPTDHNIVYMAGSSGAGVWKSTNAATSTASNITWRFISNSFKSQSIGDIAIDPL
jgi:hypothetical protein